MEGFEDWGRDDTPEDIRQLRQQKDQITAERERRNKKYREDIERKQLREEIERLGHKPCA